MRWLMVGVVGLGLAGCSGGGGECDEGFGLASDGNCYPIEPIDGLGGTGDTAPSGETADSGGETADSSSSVTVVPLGFVMTYDCTTATQIRLQITSPVLDGSEAVVDVADTANVEAHYESHWLQPEDASLAGTVFGAVWETDGTYLPGMSSRFSCAPDVHFVEENLGDVMTYVVRAYAADGSLFDCFAGGNDADNMLSKAYYDHGNTYRHDDISPENCFALRSAR